MGPACCAQGHQKDEVHPLRTLFGANSARVEERWQTCSGLCKHLEVRTLLSNTAWELADELGNGGKVGIEFKVKRFK